MTCSRLLPNSSRPVTLNDHTPPYLSGPVRREAKDQSSGGSIGSSAAVRIRLLGRVAVWQEMPQPCQPEPQPPRPLREGGGRGVLTAAAFAGVPVPARSRTGREEYVLLLPRVAPITGTPAPPPHPRSAAASPPGFAAASPHHPPPPATQHVTAPCGWRSATDPAAGGPAR